MSDTMVEGYKLAEDGHRLDKIEAQLELEAKRAEEKASKPTPNKVRLEIEKCRKDGSIQGILYLDLENTLSGRDARPFYG